MRAGLRGCRDRALRSAHPAPTTSAARPARAAAVPRRGVADRPHRPAFPPRRGPQPQPADGRLRSHRPDAPADPVRLDRPQHDPVERPPVGGCHAGDRGDRRWSRGGGHARRRACGHPGTRAHRPGRCRRRTFSSAGPRGAPDRSATVRHPPGSVRADLHRYAERQQEPGDGRRSCHRPGRLGPRRGAPRRWRGPIRGGPPHPGGPGGGGRAGPAARTPGLPPGPLGFGRPGASQSDGGLRDGRGRGHAVRPRVCPLNRRPAPPRRPRPWRLPARRGWPRQGARRRAGSPAPRSRHRRTRPPCQRP